MALTNSATQWGLISKVLHWLIALLIVAAIILGLTAEELPLSPAKLNVFIYHKSIGITVLLLVLVRLAWKLLSPQPGPATGITPRNQQRSQLGHWLLYGLMFALPLSGWILNSAANIPFKWMHWLAVPAIPGIEQVWKDAAAWVHKLLFITLSVTAIGHALMAALHHYRHDSDVLRRMWPAGGIFSWGVTLALIVATSYGIYYDSSTKPTNSPDTVATAVSSSSTAKMAEQANTEHSNTGEGQQAWLIDPQQSRLRFIGSYDGVAFDGEFKQFSAAMYFDPQQPQRGFFDVKIATASVTTYSDDWDETLPEQDWFSTASYPQANYRTQAITVNDNGYSAEGVLTIKGISKPVRLDFQWQPTANDAVNFTAEATVNRQHFAIGAGMWEEDPTIGFEVNVRVELLLTAQQ